MELYPYLKSMADMDRNAVVLCNLEHKIIYMNPAAVRSYSKHGGEGLLGKNLLDCHNEASRQKIGSVLAYFQADRKHNIVYTYHDAKENKDVYMVALRDGNGTLIGYYEKHEHRNSETAQFYDGIEQE